MKKDDLLVSRRAFTLVELLVVIAIIVVLLAILLPVAARVRRQAQVLVCPVAYQDKNDQSIHLTDLRCGYDLQLTPGYGPDREIHSMMWSPSGQRIGYQVMAKSGHEVSTLCILTPSTGKTYTHPAICPVPGQEWLFGGWIDDDRFIESAYPKTYIRDCKTGAVLKALDVDGEKVAEGPYSWTGLGWNQRYISITKKKSYSFTPGDGVVRYVRGDLSAGSIIWRPQPFKDGILRGRRDGWGFPEVDPTGECIMFPAYVSDRPDNLTQSWCAFKYRDGHTPISAVGGSITGTWLDDGNIMSMQMSVFKRDGEFVRGGKVPSAWKVAVRRHYRNAP